MICREAGNIGVACLSVFSCQVHHTVLLFIETKSRFILTDKAASLLQFRIIILELLQQELQSLRPLLRVPQLREQPLLLQEQ